VRYWVTANEQHGSRGLRAKYSRYDAQFKHSVLLTIRSGRKKVLGSYRVVPSEIPMEIFGPDRPIDRMIAQHYGDPEYDGIVFTGLPRITTRFGAPNDRHPF
jgi:hypothetical protein